MPRRIRKPSPAQPSLFSAVSPDFKTQNNRTIAVATVTIGNLLQNIPKSPDTDYGVATESQRALNQRHCVDISRYFTNTPDWVVGPIILTGDNTRLNIESGNIQAFPPDLQVLDGQHRIQGLHLAVQILQQRSENGDDKAKAALDNLLNSYIPVAFYSNNGPADQGQIFSDLNKTRAVSAAERSYLDNRDPVNNVARDALAAIPWVADHTDNYQANPGKESTDIFTPDIGKQLVRTIKKGPGKRLSTAERNRLHDQPDKQEASDALTDFLNFLPQARPEFEAVANGNSNGIPDDRDRSYVYDRSFLNFIAHTFANAQEMGKDLARLAQYIYNLNLVRSNSSNDLGPQGIELLNDKRRMLPLSHPAYEAAYDRIIANTPDQTDGNTAPA